ncbi:MAG: P-II family nitrogen regulator [Eubacteriales bacterium]
MKMVRAIVRPEKVSEVLNELADAGYAAVTKIDVVGRGKQRGVKVGDIHYDELPKELLMMVVEDDAVDEVIHLVNKYARTGEKGAFGDGKIFISAVERAFTISSGNEKL